MVGMAVIVLPGVGEVTTLFPPLGFPDDLSLPLSRYAADYLNLARNTQRTITCIAFHLKTDFKKYILVTHRDKQIIYAVDQS